MNRPHKTVIFISDEAMPRNEVLVLSAGGFGVLEQMQGQTIGYLTYSIDVDEFVFRPCGQGLKIVVRQQEEITAECKRLKKLIYQKAEANG